MPKHEEYRVFVLIGTKCVFWMHCQCGMLVGYGKVKAPIAYKCIILNRPNCIYTSLILNQPNPVHVLHAISPKSEKEREKEKLARLATAECVCCSKL